MAGIRGLSLGIDAGIETGLRFEAYRSRLSPAQLAVFDQLHAEAEAFGELPVYAREVMAPHGPWPDPFEPGCEGCSGG